MEVYFQMVLDAEALRKTCAELENEKFLGFDTETTELDPYKGELRLLQFSNGRSTHVIDLRAFNDPKNNPDLAPLRVLLSDPSNIKIAHNSKFDAKWVRHHLGVEIEGIYDTFLASQLISAGDQDRRHSLADRGQRIRAETPDRVFAAHPGAARNWRPERVRNCHTAAS